MWNRSSRSSRRATLAAIFGIALLAHTSGPAYAQSPPPDPDEFGYVTLNKATARTVAVIHNNVVVTTIDFGSGARLTGVAVAPYGDRVYVADSGTDSVWVVDPDLILPLLTETNTASIISQIPVSTDPEDLAFTPDGSKVFVANVFGQARFTVIDTAAVEANLANPAGAVTHITNNSISGTRFGVAVANVAGTSLVFGGFAGGTVVVIDPASHNFLTSFSTGGTSVQDLAASPDGKRVYVANGSGTVSVIDTDLVLQRIAGTAVDPVVKQVSVADGPLGLAVTNDGTTVYVTRNLAGKVSRIDTTAVGGPTLAEEFGVGTGPFGVAFTTDNSSALVANKSGNALSAILGGGVIPIPLNTLAWIPTQGSRANVAGVVGDA